MAGVSNEASLEKKPVCKYGANCYRRNPDHIKNYKHPPKRPLTDSDAPHPKRPCQDDRPPSQNTEHSPGDGAKMECRVPGDAGATASQSLTATPGDAESDVEASQSTAEMSERDQPTEEDAAEDCNLLPESPQSERENIKQKFLVDMPEDFYSFLEFCKSVNNKKPQEALLPCGLRLGGPFLLVLGLIKPKKRTQEFYLTFCRYYFDPPEVQTVLCGDAETGYHIGYFRDDPSELPVQVVANRAENDANFTVLGDNLFAAVSRQITSLLSEADAVGRQQLSPLKDALQSWAQRAGFSLETRTPAMRQRERRVLGRTLQGLGVVVPYDKKNDVGYRSIPETPASLRKMLRRVVEADSDEARNAALDKLQEVITDVQFANDEGDPGMGLELGLDAFSVGGEALHSTVKHLLLVAYDLLNRPVSAKILQAHLANRRKGMPMI